MTEADDERLLRAVLGSAEARALAAVDRYRERREEAFRQRAAFWQGRQHGLAQRHAAKLRNLVAEVHTADTTKITEETSMPVRVTYCPSCRRERTARRVGAATVDGRKVELVQCPERSCELVWAARPDRRLAAA